MYNNGNFSMKLSSKFRGFSNFSGLKLKSCQSKAKQGKQGSDTNLG